MRNGDVSLYRAQVRLICQRGEVTSWISDRVAHAMCWRQNVTTSVLFGVKHIDLGNGGVGLPGSLGKLKRLDTTPVKRNSPGERESTAPIHEQTKHTRGADPSKRKDSRAHR